MPSYDSCPKCGARKRRKNRQCASCHGYGLKRHVMPSGYVRVWVPGHPVANADGYALEHRLVLHEAGVELPDGYHVHHVNGDKTDNRLDNLRVLLASDHLRHHILKAGVITNQFGSFGLRQKRPCERCSKPFMPWTSRSRFCSRDCSNRRAVPA